MPIRHYLRFTLEQIIHFIFASQHLALVVVQAVLIFLAGFAVVGWLTGILHLIWKANPQWFGDTLSSFVTWAMGSRTVASFSGSYHAGTQETLGFLSKVYFVSTIPVFMYDRLRNLPLDSTDVLKRRLKRTGILALVTAVSFALFEMIWSEGTWIVLALIVAGAWISVVVLSCYVFLLQMLRDTLLHLFDNQPKIG